MSRRAHSGRILAALLLACVFVISGLLGVGRGLRAAPPALGQQAQEERDEDPVRAQARLEGSAGEALFKHPDPSAHLPSPELAREPVVLRLRDHRPWLAAAPPHVFLPRRML